MNTDDALRRLYHSLTAAARRAEQRGDHDAAEELSRRRDKVSRLIGVRSTEDNRRVDRMRREWQGYGTIRDHN